MFKKYAENFKLSSLKRQKPILAGENFEKYELWTFYMLQKPDFEPSKLQLKQNF